jgi:hypothetical protein
MFQPLCVYGRGRGIGCVSKLTLARVCFVANHHSHLYGRMLRIFISHCTALDGIRACQEGPRHLAEFSQREFYSSSGRAPEPYNEVR